jgi:hypothetical protein
MSLLEHQYGVKLLESTVPVLQKFRHGGSEAFHPELIIEEDGGDAGAREKIVQVVVQLLLFLDLGLKLRIHCDQFFVKGLQLFS